jgi:hypothetical protein
MTMNELTHPPRDESTKKFDQRQSKPWVNRAIELAESIARQLLDVVHTTFPRLH